MEGLYLFPVFIIIPIGITILFFNFPLALRLLRIFFLKFAQIVIINIHYRLMIDHHRMSPEMCIERKSLTIMTR